MAVSKPTLAASRLFFVHVAMSNPQVFSRSALDEIYVSCKLQFFANADEPYFEIFIAT
jgi:hypothetical protein